MTSSVNKTLDYITQEDIMCLVRLALEKKVVIIDDFKIFKNKFKITGNTLKRDDAIDRLIKLFNDYGFSLPHDITSYIDIKNMDDESLTLMHKTYEKVLIDNYHFNYMLYASPILSVFNYVTGKFLRADTGEVLVDNETTPLDKGYNIINLLDYFKSLLNSNNNIPNDTINVLKLASIMYPECLVGYKIENKNILSAVNAGLLVNDCVYGIKNVNFELKLDNVLRTVILLSGYGYEDKDVKFKSFPRKMRKLIICHIENILAESDLKNQTQVNINQIKKKKRLWVRLFHSLHTGEYANKYILTYTLAKELRQDKKIETVLSVYEQLIKDNEFMEAANLLANKNIGEFARRFDYLLRNIDSKGITDLINLFENKVENINTRILLQMYNHFINRDKEYPRHILTTGKSAKKVDLPTLEPLSQSVINDVTTIIYRALKNNYLSKNFFDNKRVYIDKEMYKLYLPMNVSSANTGTVFGRGSRIYVKNTKRFLRFFVYWRGMFDIDLTVNVYNKNGENLGHCSFSSLNYKDMIVHSGDVRSAPNGGSEFITLDLDKFNDEIITFNINCFDCDDFTSVDDCFAGYMFLDDINDKLAMYHPTMCDNKYYINKPTKGITLFSFDTHDNHMTWLDMPTNNNVSFHDSLINIKKQLSLGEFIEMFTHNIVSDRKAGDVIVDFNGDVTPQDIDLINSMM